MSPRIILRPNTYLAGSDDPDNVPETALYGVNPDRALALADDTDATGHFGAAADVGASFPEVHTVGFEDLAALPVDARISYLQVRMRMALAGAYHQAARYQLTDPGGDLNREDFLAVTRDGVYREAMGPTVGRNAVLHRDWDADTVNDIRMNLRFFDTDAIAAQAFVPSGDVYVSEVYLDVYYSRAGAVAVDTVEPRNVAQPTVTWRPFSPDSKAKPQAYYRLAVFDEATYTRPGFTPRNAKVFKPVYDTGRVPNATTRSAQIGKRLRDGINYRAYVDVWQPWAGYAGPWVNPTPAFRSFTIDLPPLAPVPQPMVTSDAERGVVDITMPAGYAPGTSDPVHWEAQRSVDDGATWDDVRTTLALDASERQTFTDYEAPFYVDVLYRVRSSSDFNNSDWSEPLATYVAATANWLTDPADPSRNMAVKIIGPWNASRPEPQTRHDPLLSADSDELPASIVVSDGIKAWKGKLTIQAESEDERDRLLVLIGSSRPLLLRDVLRRRWYIRPGASQDVEWLRAIPTNRERTPVRDLHRVSFDWNEVRAP